MSNIEDRLRELGRESREAVHGIQPDQRSIRRIRTRRGALVGSVTGFILLAGFAAASVIPGWDRANEVATDEKRGVRMVVSPAVSAPGQPIEVRIHNDSNDTIGYGLTYELEKRQGIGGTWTSVRNEGLVPLPLISIPPGEVSDPQPVHEVQRRINGPPVPLGPGTYRISKDIEVPLGGDSVTLTATFRIQSGWIPVASLQELEQEDVIYRAVDKVFILWNDGDPIALSALVPHETGFEERALYCPSSRTFDGPHGERFDELGYYFGGPAQRGLDRVRIGVSGGIVQIDPQEVTEGPPRREGSRLGPQGFLCAEGPIEGRPGFAMEMAEARAEAFALWPEDTRSAAIEACSSDDGWRGELESVAVSFAEDILGWNAPRPTLIDRSRTEAEYELRPRVSADAGVRIYMIEVVEDCWSVRSVSRLPDKRPTGVSASVRGREVSVGSVTLGATSAYIEVGYGGRVVSREVRGTGGATFELDFDPDTSGHFLILLRDEKGDVFSAAGSALPAGDFAAG